MGLIIEPLIKVGDKFTANEETHGINREEFPITITQHRHDRVWGADGKSIPGFLVNEVWIENGDLTKAKEEDMGLMLPEEQAQVTHSETAPSPRKGQPLLDDMRGAYKAADDAGMHSSKLIDGLNNLYRSKAYRDMISSMLSQGHIDPDVVKEMQSLLYRYRYARRTPNAKAWRQQWP